MGFIALCCLASFFLDGCKKTDTTPPDATVVVIVADGGTPTDTWDEPTDGPGATYLSPLCAKACINLRKLECLDGYRRPGEDSCYVVCKRAEGTGKIDFHTQCIIDARDLAGVRACGTYRCLK